MAELYKGMLCIYANELIVYNPARRVGSEKGFVPEGTFQTWKKKKYVNVVRLSAPGFPALVEFDTMRRDIRDKYIEIYGDPHQGIRIPGLLENALQPDEAAFSFFDTFQYGVNGELTLKPEQKTKYFLQARVLNAILFLRKDRNRNKIGGGSTKINVWKNLSNLCNDLETVKDEKGKPVYQHGLPQNWSALKRKAERYESEGYRSLINENFGNMSASILKKEQQQAIIHKLLSHHNNLNNEQVRIMYNAVAKEKGWTEIKSLGTVENWRKKFGPETEPGRRGLTEFRNTITKQIKRSAPKRPLTYVSIDGWTAELAYRRQGIDKNGHKVTTYHHRLTVVFILDACSKYPIGYAIGDAENVNLIKEAMKNAVNHSRELFGTRFKPRQIQTDNYGRGCLKPFYEACCMQYTPARVHNAKSKVVEPYNNYFNETWCKLFDNFTGYNVTSDKKNQPNQDYFNNNKKNIPDREGCMKQLLWCIEQERKKRLGKYMKAWEMVDESEKLPMSNQEYLSLFGENNGWTHTISGKGLELSVNGLSYFYEFNGSLTDISYHYHDRWLVRYDPNDMSEVLISNARGDKAHRLVEEVGSVRYLMQERHIVPMALHDQSPEDFAYRAKVEQDNKELEQHVIERMSRATDLAQEVMADLPQLGQGNPLLERFCITDSRGRHKDNRNSLREIAADAEYADIGVKLPKETLEKVTSSPPKENAVKPEDINFNMEAFMRSVRY